MIPHKTTCEEIDNKSVFGKQQNAKTTGVESFIIWDWILIVESPEKSKKLL